MNSIVGDAMLAGGVLTIKEGTVFIEAGAYMGRQDIVEVRFPDTVIEICGGTHDGAFQGCSGITTLHLPDTLAVIGEDAFMGCSGITTLHLPSSLNCVGKGAFEDCSGITTLHLPDTLAEIGDYAFSDCPGITTIHLPDTLAKISTGAFQGCSGITALHLPDTLAVIGVGAFRGCSGITSVCLPTQLVKAAGDKDKDGDEDVEAMSSEDDKPIGSFEGCTRLTRVLAPDMLASSKMANTAVVFLGCPVLKANGGPGLAPHSTVKLTRHRHWHPTMHHWCPTAAATECVRAALICAARLDINGSRAGQGRHGTPSSANLPPTLPPELWLHILTFIRRDHFGVEQ